MKISFRSAILRELGSWPRGMQVQCAGLIVILIVNLALFAAGYGDLAAILSPVATLFWMLGMVAWIVFFDSKKRWPKRSVFQRYASLITFDSSRDE